MASCLKHRLCFACIMCGLLHGLTAPARADEVWVAPTSQADLGGLGIGSNGVWPATPAGAVRLAWAVPDDLQTFQSAKVVLIPHTPGGAATLICSSAPRRTTTPCSARAPGLSPTPSTAWPINCSKSTSAPPSRRGSAIPARTIWRWWLTRRRRQRPITWSDCGSLTTRCHRSACPHWEQTTRLAACRPRQRLSAAARP